MEKWELPEQWVWSTIIEGCETVFGQSPPSSSYNQEGNGLPFFQGKAEFGARHPAVAKWCTEPTREAEVGDILISVRAPVGPTNIAKEHCAIGRGLAAIRPAIDQRYVEYWLKRTEQILAAQGTGTTFSAITKKVLNSHPLPIAPLPEQRRIVEKIETLFAELAKGEEALREVQRLLARYRQSVLKAAFTGALTFDWRAANGPPQGSGEELLAHILKTRRESWQGRGKYKEPVEPKTNGLPELAEGWVWATFDQLFNVFGGATPSRREPDNWGGKIPWVSSGEVAFCRIYQTHEKVTEKGLSSCSTKVHPEGTVLLAMIGEGKTRGQAAILDIPACNNQNAAAIRVAESGLPPEYIFYFLMANYEESRRKGQGGNQPALNGAKVKAFTLPLPSSFAETQEIVDRIEDLFVRIDKLEEWCGIELQRSAALRRSILKDSFCGKLVAQDPSDEPANKLLDRIRAARSATHKAKRRKATA